MTMEMSERPGLSLQRAVPAPPWSRRLLRLWKVFAFILISLPGLPLMYLYSFLKAARLVPERRIAHLRTRGISLWLSWILRALGIRIRVHGRFPESAVLMVPNHQSYLDILVLLAQFPSVFLSKADVRDWPVFGHLTANLGTLYLDRERKRMMKDVLPQIEEHLRWGIPVAVFLETTTTDGQRMLPFRPGFLEAAVSTGTPCLPLAIRYATPDDPLPVSATICWWGGMVFFSHLWRLLALGRIDVDITVGQPVSTTREMDRKALGEQLRGQILALLGLQG